MKKLTTEEFIEKAKKIHGDKYDYSKVNYVNAKTKVTIICKKCGNVFDQLPSSHLSTNGCPNRCYSEKIVYWNKEKCETVSKLCNSRSDFQKRYQSAYKYARANKLLDSFSWLDSISLKERLKETKHLIYCVSFHHEAIKYAYIGLTNNWRRRRGEHAVEGAIFNVCKKLGLDIKEVLETCTEILEVNLTPREAQILEDYWRNEKDEEGYIILNSRKTGEGTGSLGSLGRKYTTLEEAENALKMALQKNPNLSRHDFSILDQTAYRMLLSADKDNGGISRLPKSSRYKYVDEQIIQFNLDNIYIKTWKNAADIKKALGLSTINIHSCCIGKQKTASGFKWMYKEDYDKLVKNKI